MSQPKKRKHPHHTNTPPHHTAKMSGRVIIVSVFIFILFGLGIAFFAAGYNIGWLIAGAVIGGLAGYLFGYQVAKGLMKR